MRLLTPSPQRRLSSRRLSAAAENIAAAQFAIYGFDVLEQGAQARYVHGLAVANADGMMKLVVHGSIRGFWNLVDPFLDRSAPRSPAQCHKAIDRWLDRQSASLTYCLVQFESSDLTSMPRVYLASAGEIAGRLHASVELLGDTALYEQFEVEDGSGRHVIEALPAEWRFSQERVAELMEGSRENEVIAFRFSEAAACTACAAVKPAACVHCLPMMN